MRLFSIILLTAVFSACSGTSAEEQVDTAADAPSDTTATAVDSVPAAADTTTTLQDVLVIDTVVVEPTTDVTEEE